MSPPLFVALSFASLEVVPGASEESFEDRAHLLSAVCLKVVYRSAPPTLTATLTGVYAWIAVQLEIRRQPSLVADVQRRHSLELVASLVLDSEAVNKV